MKNYNYILTPDGELYHYGVKGMKWGVRRYQKKDGSLTAEGLKRYRKDYDHLKQTQQLSERAKTVNKTGISVADDYNSRYYNKQAQNELKLFVKKFGNRGLEQFDEEVMREGRAAAEKVKRESELFNKTIQETYDMNLWFNQMFLRDPQRDYESTYNRYLEDNLVTRRDSAKSNVKRTSSIPNTTDRLVNLNMVDERTGKKTRTITAHESIYTESELRKLEREANKTGKYRKIYV